MTYTYVRSVDPQALLLEKKFKGLWDFLGCPDGTEGGVYKLRSSPPGGYRRVVWQVAEEGVAVLVPPVLGPAGKAGKIPYPDGRVRAGYSGKVSGRSPSP